MTCLGGLVGAAVGGALGSIFVLAVGGAFTWLLFKGTSQLAKTYPERAAEYERRWLCLQCGAQGDRDTFINRA